MGAKQSCRIQYNNTWKKGENALLYMRADYDEDGNPIVVQMGEAYTDEGQRIVWGPELMEATLQAMSAPQKRPSFWNRLERTWRLVRWKVFGILPF